MCTFVKQILIKKVKMEAKKLIVKSKNIDITLSFEKRKHQDPNNEIIKALITSVFLGGSCNAIKQIFEGVEIDFDGLYKLRNQFQGLIFEAEKKIKNIENLKIKETHTFH